MTFIKLNDHSVITRIICLILVASFVLSDVAFAFEDAGRCALSPPYATKPSARIVEQPDGTLAVETNEIDNGLRRRWAFVDISLLIGQMLEFTRAKKLKRPAASVLIPLIETHLRTREGQGERIDPCFDIKAIEEVRDVNGDVIGFTLPIATGRSTRRLTYTLTDPGSGIWLPIAHDKKVFINSFDREIVTIPPDVLDAAEAFSRLHHEITDEGSERSLIAGLTSDPVFEKHGVYYPSHKWAVAAFMRHIGVKPGERMLEIGSAGATLSTFLCDLFRISATCVEIVPTFHRQAAYLREQFIRKGYRGATRTELINGSFTAVDFSAYSLIYYFALGTNDRRELIDKLLTVKEGSRILVYGRIEPELEKALVGSGDFRMRHLQIPEHDVTIEMHVFTRVSPGTAPQPFQARPKAPHHADALVPHPEYPDPIPFRFDLANNAFFAIGDGAFLDVLATVCDADTGVLTFALEEAIERRIHIARGKITREMLDALTRTELAARFASQSPTLAGDESENATLTINAPAFQRLFGRDPGFGLALLQVSITHELLGHEIGRHDEAELTAEDVTLFLELLAKDHALNEGYLRRILRTLSEVIEKDSDFTAALKDRIASNDMPRGAAPSPRATAGSFQSGIEWPRTPDKTGDDPVRDLLAWSTYLQDLLLILRKLDTVHNIWITHEREGIQIERKTRFGGWLAHDMAGQMTFFLGFGDMLARGEIASSPELCKDMVRYYRSLEAGFTLPKTASQITEEDLASIPMVTAGTRKKPHTYAQAFNYFAHHVLTGEEGKQRKTILDKAIRMMEPALSGIKDAVNAIAVGNGVEGIDEKPESDAANAASPTAHIIELLEAALGPLASAIVREAVMVTARLPADGPLVFGELVAIMARYAGEATGGEDPIYRLRVTLSEHFERRRAEIAGREFSALRPALERRARDVLAAFETGDARAITEGEALLHDLSAMHPDTATPTIARLAETVKERVDRVRNEEKEESLLRELLPTIPEEMAREAFESHGVSLSKIASFSKRAGVSLPHMLRVANHYFLQDANRIIAGLRDPSPETIAQARSFLKKCAGIDDDAIRDALRSARKTIRSLVDAHGRAQTEDRLAAAEANEKRRFQDLMASTPERLVREAIDAHDSSLLKLERFAVKNGLKLADLTAMMDRYLLRDANAILDALTADDEDAVENAAAFLKKHARSDHTQSDALDTAAQKIRSMTTDRIRARDEKRALAQREAEDAALRELATRDEIASALETADGNPARIARALSSLTGHAKIRAYQVASLIDLYGLGEVRDAILRRKEERAAARAKEDRIEGMREILQLLTTPRRDLSPAAMLNLFSDMRILTRGDDPIRTRALEADVDPDELRSLFLSYPDRYDALYPEGPKRRTPRRARGDKSDTPPSPVIDSIDTPGLLVHGMDQSRFEHGEKAAERLISILTEGLKSWRDTPDRLRHSSWGTPLHPDVISLSMVGRSGYLRTNTAFQGYGPIPGEDKNDDRFSIAFLLDPAYVRDHRDRFIPAGAYFSSDATDDYAALYRDERGAILNGLREPHSAEGLPLLDRDGIAPDEVWTKAVPPEAIAAIIAHEEYAHRLYEIVTAALPGRALRIFSPEGRLLHDVKGPPAAEEMPLSADTPVLTQKRTQQFADWLAHRLTFGAVTHMPKWMAALFVAPWYEQIKIYFLDAFIAGHEPDNEDIEASLLEGWAWIFIGGCAATIACAYPIPAYMTIIGVARSDNLIITLSALAFIFQSATITSHFLVNLYRVIHNAIPGTAKEPLLTQDLDGYGSLLRQNRGVPMPLGDDPLSADTIIDIFGTKPDLRYRLNNILFTRYYNDAHEGFRNAVYSKSALKSSYKTAYYMIDKAFIERLQHPLTKLPRIVSDQVAIRRFSAQTPERMNELRQAMDRYYKHWDLVSFRIFRDYITANPHRVKKMGGLPQGSRSDKGDDEIRAYYGELLERLKEIDAIIGSILLEGRDHYFQKNILKFINRRTPAELITRQDMIRLYADMRALTGDMQYIEFVMAGAKIKQDKGHSFARPSRKTGVIKLKGAWNPVAGPYEKMEKLDIDIDAGSNLYVVTGANEAGKSTILKTIALSVLMNQMGLPVPADGAAEISIFKNIYTLVPGPEDLEPGESRHTLLMKRLAALIQKVGPGDLVMIDEAHMGSDYKDLVALTSVLLQDLVATGATVIYATHLKETVKQLTETIPNLRPQQILIKPQDDGSKKRELREGIAQHSLAIDTLKRAGFPEEIIGWMEEYYKAITEKKAVDLPPVKDTDKGRRFDFSREVERMIHRDELDRERRGERRLYLDENEEDEEKPDSAKRSIAEKARDILFPADNFYFGLEKNNAECSRRFIERLTVLKPLKQWHSEIFGRSSFKDAVKKRSRGAKHIDPEDCVEILRASYDDMRSHLKTRLKALEDMAGKGRGLMADEKAKDAIDSLIRKTRDAIAGRDEWFEPMMRRFEEHMSLARDWGDVKQTFKDYTESVEREALHSQGIDELRFLDKNIGIALSMSEHGLHFPDVGETFSIKEARSPFIPDAIPIDLPDIQDDPQFIITGPNHSGKTAAIMTLDVIIELIKQGLPVQARVTIPNDMLGRKGQIITFLGAKEEMAAGESYFRNVANNLLKLLYKANPGDIIIMDELHGSDYWELSALQAAMIRYFDRLGVTVFFNTHMREGLAAAKDITSIKFLKTDVAVEADGSIQYAYSLSEDPNLESKSYGIETARPLLTPDQYRRALAIRKRLEKRELWRTGLYDLAQSKEYFQKYLEKMSSVNIWRLQASLRALPAADRKEFLEWSKARKVAIRLITQAHSMLYMPAMELWETVPAIRDADVTPDTYTTDKAFKDVMVVAERHKVVAHGTANDELDNLGDIARHRLRHEWALLNIVIEDSIVQGEHNYLNTSWNADNPAKYGPYLVIFGRKSGPHPAIYLVPHDDAARFLRQGIDEAVRLEFMTPEKAAEAKAKIMTYRQFADADEKLDDILTGAISPVDLEIAPGAESSTHLSPEPQAREEDGVRPHIAGNTEKMLNGFTDAVLLGDYSFGLGTQREFAEYRDEWYETARAFLARDHRLKEEVFSSVDALDDDEAVKLAESYLATPDDFKNTGHLGFYTYSTYNISDGALPLRLALVQAIIQPGNAAEILFPKVMSLFASGEQVERSAARDPAMIGSILGIHYAIYRATEALRNRVMSGEYALINSNDLDGLHHRITDELGEPGHERPVMTERARLMVWRLLCVGLLAAPSGAPGRDKTLDLLRELIRRLAAEYPAFESVGNDLSRLDASMEATTDSNERKFYRNIRAHIPADIVNRLFDGIGATPKSIVAPGAESIGHLSPGSQVMITNWDEAVSAARGAPKVAYAKLFGYPDKTSQFRGVRKEGFLAALKTGEIRTNARDGETWWGDIVSAVGISNKLDKAMHPAGFEPGSVSIVFEITAETAARYGISSWGGRTYRGIKLNEVSRAWLTSVDTEDDYNHGLIRLVEVRLPGMEPEPQHPEEGVRPHTKEPPPDFSAGWFSQVRFAKGAYIMRQGEPSQYLYIVKDGTVEIEVDGQTITTIGAGDWLGEIGLFLRIPRTASARVVSPGGATLYRISERRFRKQLQGSGRIEERLHDIVVRRMVETVKKLRHPARLEVYDYLPGALKSILQALPAPRGKKVMIVGHASLPFLSVFLAWMGMEVTVVDIDSDLLEIDRAFFDSMAAMRPGLTRPAYLAGVNLDELSRERLAGFGLREHSFDLILALDLIGSSWTLRGDPSKFVTNIALLLKQGGTAFVSSEELPSAQGAAPKLRFDETFGKLLGEDRVTRVPADTIEPIITPYGYLNDSGPVPTPNVAIRLRHTDGMGILTSRRHFLMVSSASIATAARVLAPAGSGILVSIVDQAADDWFEETEGLRLFEFFGGVREALEKRVLKLFGIDAEDWGLIHVFDDAGRPGPVNLKQNGEWTSFSNPRLGLWVEYYDRVITDIYRDPSLRKYLSLLGSDSQGFTLVANAAPDVMQIVEQGTASFVRTIYRAARLLQDLSDSTIDAISEADPREREALLDDLFADDADAAEKAARCRDTLYELSDKLRSLRDRLIAIPVDRYQDPDATEWLAGEETRLKAAIEALETRRGALRAVLNELEKRAGADSGGIVKMPAPSFYRLRDERAVAERPVRMGTHVQGFADFDRLAHIPLNVIEIKPDAFHGADRFYAWDPQAGAFIENEESWRRLAAFLKDRKAVAQIHFPYKKFEALDGTTRFFSIGDDADHPKLLQLFRLFEAARVKYGLADELVVTIHPPHDILREKFAELCARQGVTDATDHTQLAPEIKDAIEREVLDSANRFLITLGRQIETEGWRMKVGVENQAHSAANLWSVGRTIRDFERLMKGTSDAIQLTFDMGHSLLSRDSYVEDALTFTNFAAFAKANGKYLVNYHAHENDRWSEDPGHADYHADKHRFPTDKHIPGFPFHLERVAREKTTLIFEVNLRSIPPQELLDRFTAIARRVKTHAARAIHSKKDITLFALDPFSMSAAIALITAAVDRILDIAAAYPTTAYIAVNCIGALACVSMAVAAFRWREARTIRRLEKLLREDRTKHWWDMRSYTRIFRWKYAVADIEVIARKHPSSITEEIVNALTEKLTQSYAYDDAFHRVIVDALTVIALRHPTLGKKVVSNMERKLFRYRNITKQDATYPMRVPVILACSSVLFNIAKEKPLLISAPAVTALEKAVGMHQLSHEARKTILGTLSQVVKERRDLIAGPMISALEGLFYLNDDTLAWSDYDNAANLLVDIAVNYRDLTDESIKVLERIVVRTGNSLAVNALTDIALRNPLYSEKVVRMLESLAHRTDIHRSAYEHLAYLLGCYTAIRESFVTEETVKAMRAILEHNGLPHDAYAKATEALTKIATMSATMFARVYTVVRDQSERGRADRVSSIFKSTNPYHDSHPLVKGSLLTEIRDENWSAIYVSMGNHLYEPERIRQIFLSPSQEERTAIAMQVKQEIYRRAKAENDKVWLAPHEFPRDRLSDYVGVYLFPWDRFCAFMDEYGYDAFHKDPRAYLDGKFEDVDLSKTKDGKPQTKPMAPDAPSVLTPSDAERLQAEYFKDLITYIESARGEAKDSKDLIVMLGTSWIKGYVKGQACDAGAIQPLIQMARRYCEQHGITFIDTEDTDILTGLAKTREGKDGAKVLVLAGKETILSDAFSTLRDDENVFMAGVDGENVDGESYIRLIEMLTIGLKLTLGMPAATDSPNILVTPDSRYRNVFVFLPRAEPIKFSREQRDAFYKVQISA